VREYFAEGRWREYVESLIDLYRGRRDVMLEALERYFPPQAEWTRPEGGLFIWATLPDYIDTGDLLAKALRENVAFVPGQSAYVDGRGASSMRLNFSGSNEEQIREGSAASARSSGSSQPLRDADRRGINARRLLREGARRATGNPASAGCGGGGVTGGTGDG